MSKTGFRIACLAGMIGLLSPALSPVLATEQVYHPVSPTLGGNPLNGSFLLSTAQAQGEGVNSGNNGPTINFPDLSPTVPTGGSQNNGTSGSGSSSGATSQATRNFLANPLGTNSRMP